MTLVEAARTDLGLPRTVTFDAKTDRLGWVEFDREAKRMTLFTARLEGGALTERKERVSARLVYPPRFIP